MPTTQELMEALRAADSAGNTEDAQRIASMIQNSAVEEQPVGGIASVLGGIPEAGMALGTGLYSMATEGLQGLGRAVMGQPLSENVEEMQRGIEDTTYQPRTVFGQGITETVADIGEGIAKGGRWVGEALTPEEYEAAGGTIGEIAPDIITAMLPFTKAGQAMSAATGRGIRRGIKQIPGGEAVVGAATAPGRMIRHYIETPAELMERTLGHAAVRRWRMNEMEGLDLAHKYDSDIESFQRTINPFLKDANLGREFKAAWMAEKGARSKVDDVLKKARVPEKVRSDFQTFLKKSMDERALSMNDAFKSFKSLGDDYVPRRVVDYSKFDDLKANQIEELFKWREEKGGISQADFESELNRLLKGGATPTTKARTSVHAKRRKGGDVEEDMLDAYADPFDGMRAYFNETGKAIAERKFLGEGKTTKDSIATFVDKYSEGKDLSRDDINRLRKALETRYSPQANRAPGPGFQKARDVGLMTTIGNPFSAALQASDIIGAVGRHGGSVRGKITPEDVGIRQIAHDVHGTNTSTGKTLDKILKWSGFQKMDQLGKKAHVNGAANKLAKKSDSALRREFKDIIPPKNMNDFIRAVRNKDIRNEDYRYTLGSEVMEVQPISLIDMPVLYNMHPNGRIVYQLKTWAVRFINTMREDFRRAKGAEGADKRREYLKLSRYVGTMAAASAGVDVTRDMLRTLIGGNEVDTEEIPNELAFSVLGIMFLNKYNLQELSSGDTAGAISGIVVPPVADLPVQIGLDIWDLMQGEPLGSSSSLGSIPIAGPFIREALKD